MNAESGILKMKITEDAGDNLGAHSTNCEITARNVGRFFGCVASTGRFIAKEAGSECGWSAKGSVFDIKYANTGLGRAAQDCYFKVREGFVQPIGDASQKANVHFAELVTHDCTFAFYKLYLFQGAQQSITKERDNKIQLLEEGTDRILQEEII